MKVNTQKFGLSGHMTIKERAFKYIINYFAMADDIVKTQSCFQYKLWSEKHYTYLKSSDLYRITKLDLSYTDIKILPSEFGYLSTLEYLDISGNNISYLDECIWNLTNLKELRIGSLIFGGNNIAVISKSIKNLKKLEVLIISLNDKIIELPKEILELKNLSLLIVTQEHIYHSDVVKKLMNEKNCTVMFE